tara:strand:- start:52 stop:240 length:189 start_codon:yes stop_codon:yes gene_type:complete
MKVGDLVAYKGRRGVVLSKEGDKLVIFFEKLGSTVEIPEEVMEDDCLNWEVISEGERSNEGR